MSTQTPPRPAVSPAAVISLVLGLLSPLLSLIAAIPAMLIGLLALRAIHRSDGRLGGAWLAIAGMSLGALAGTATVVGVALIVVSRTQTTRDRVECTDHLRAMGLAVGAYHDHHDKTFPAGTVLAPNLPANKRLSWLANLLPYLGGDTPSARPWKALAGRLDPREPWDSPANQADQERISIFLCRAWPAASTPTTPGLSSYVGLTGVDPGPATPPVPGFFRYDPTAEITDSATLAVNTLSLAAQGLSHQAFGAGPAPFLLGVAESVITADRTVRDADLTAGTSHTLIATETGQDNGPWAAAGRPTLRGLEPGEQEYLGPGRPFGGLHAGGANALYADASVRFLRDTMVPAEFRAEATLVGHAAEGPE
jgi:prepilin-type processing-associated H-X9-DG protein